MYVFQCITSICILCILQTAGEAYQQRMQALHAAKPLLCPGPFRMGFHSIPSMKQLHMHVISQVLAMLQDVTHA